MTIILGVLVTGLSSYSIVCMAAGWVSQWMLVAESSAGAFAWNAQWLTVESARVYDTRVY